MVRFLRIKRVCGNPVVALSERGRDFVLDKKSLQQRIKNLEKKGFNTNVEREALTLLEKEEEVK